MTDTASCQHDGPGNEGGILAGPGQLGTQEARLPSAAGEAGGSRGRAAAHTASCYSEASVNTRSSRALQAQADTKADLGRRRLGPRVGQPHVSGNM